MISLIDVEKELGKNSSFIGEIKSYPTGKNILFITKGYFQNEQMENL